MWKRHNMMTKFIIVAVVFPLLVIVFGSVFRLLAMTADEMISSEVAWKNTLVALLGYAGLLGGGVVAFLVSRRMWPKTHGPAQDQESDSRA